MQLLLNTHCSNWGILSETIIKNIVDGPNTGYSAMINFGYLTENRDMIYPIKVEGENLYIRHPYDVAILATYI
jgi:hypothetical protein